MRRSLKPLSALLLAATLSVPAVALAQGPMASPKQMHGPMMRPMADRVDTHIADIHDKLHITAEQQTKWEQFAQAMRDDAQHMHQNADERASKISTMSASQNMQSYAQMATQHAQDLQNLAAAFQPLYDSLSPDQQHTADALFRDSGMRHGHRHVSRRPMNPG